MWRRCSSRKGESPVVILLGIDTSTSCGSIALVDEQRVLAEWNLTHAKTHCERLLPGLARVLEAADTPLARVDLIAVAVGPGSFTGLRIGLATAKALALGTGKPMVGIPTLDVLAENIAASPLVVCPTLDARKGEVFAALYRKPCPGSSERMSPYLSLTPEHLVEEIQEPALLLGDGALLYRERLQNRARHPLLLAPLECHAPRASVLCRLGMHKYRTEGATDPAEIRALYVRPSDAEINRAKNAP